MKQAEFYRKSDESLVLVDANFPEHGVTLALDTIVNEKLDKDLHICHVFSGVRAVNSGNSWR